ncbi:MAG: DUF4249 domain-containing protein [Tannerellaceae bacterium]|jgi:hypothetical protein|nr:DUF4249 domain-containing protein [Tannerellaceae bacterium]
MKRTGYIVLSIGIVIVSGCTKDVDLPVEGLTPKIVINSIIDMRSDTNLIKVSESVSVFSDSKAGIVEDLDLQLSINGTVCDNLTLDTIIDIHKYYQFVSPIQPGDKLEIVAHTPIHEIVKGYDIAPDNTVEIKGINHSWFKKDGWNYLRLYVTLKDDPHVRNFYRIIIKAYTKQQGGTPLGPYTRYTVYPSINELDGDWSYRKVFVDDEMLFKSPTEQEEDSRDPFYFKIFTDELFQGKEYTLNVYIQYDDYYNDPYSDYVRQFVKVEIHSLSEKLYRNLHSQELAFGTMNDLFYEQVKLYTNMQGGYGILGIYNGVKKIKLVGEKEKI